MDIDLLEDLFLYSLLCNFAVLMFWFLMMVFGADFIYNKHQKFFKISREQFIGTNYMLMGAFKLANFTFFLAPYIALKIISN